MVELVPRPLPNLVTRMFRELAAQQSIFDLPAGKFFLGAPDHDLGVEFHGRRAATPLGPAAGPHSQLAQNIVLAWLGGSRIIELKTVQILDELEIPRPCIDMRNIGYNVEWSQELKLEQSLEEYVKASMLLDMLVVSGELALAPGFDDVILDMSVGYDLAGIQSERVQTFLRGMMDASAVVERLRGEIPDEYAHLRDLPFRTRLSDTLTLSTFHGCPPDEIERIIDWLMHEFGLHCVVKLNPTLLGFDEVRRLLHDELGYGHIVVPQDAFEKDTRWDQAVGFVERLGATAKQLGVGFGVKFSNTLVVDHGEDFLPAEEKAKYLSGQPLHVLAMHLVQRFRAHFGAGIPVSFSAGIDRANFPDAVALGLTPITVCSDLLRTGGYARQAAYLHELIRRMDALGARSVDQFITATAGAAGQDRETAVLHNTAAYVEPLAGDGRYGHASNTKTPRKIGSQLVLFDCITCDKCVPVCPNDANFTLPIAPQELPVYVLRPGAGGTWQREDQDTVTLTRKHQIATFADFCNECGNCDVFCPEDGGPYIEKPRFFGSLEEWRKVSTHDGFWVERDGATDRVAARFGGAEFHATFCEDRREYSGAGFAIAFRDDDPAGTAQGQAEGEVDMRWFAIMDVIRAGALDPGRTNWVNC